MYLIGLTIQADTYLKDSHWSITWTVIKSPLLIGQI
jgi:hypothetical protein